VSLLDELPHRCSIFRYKRLSDGIGGNTFEAALVSEDVECWQQDAGASTIKEYDKKGIRVTTSIYFVEDPGVDERHKILITERFGVAQANLDITDVSNPDVYDVESGPRPDNSAGMGVVWRVDCSDKTSNTQ